VTELHEDQDEERRRWGDERYLKLKLKAEGPRLKESKKAPQLIKEKRKLKKKKKKKKR
jgi:hypothetical protein